MPRGNGKFLSMLPVLSFLGYLLFSCVICAAMTGDARLLKLWFVSSPVLIAAALTLAKIAGNPDTGA